MDKKLNWHRLHVENISCKKGNATKLPGELWYATLSVRQDNERISPKERACGRFVLASNDQSLTAQEMLTYYKEQDTVEKGFRFLKDPRFELNHVFLNTPTRIEALMMIMTLCLLVNNIGQYKIRQGLKYTEQTVLSQVKKPTQRPTLRLISQCLKGVIMLYDNGKWFATCNVSPDMEKVFRILGKGTLRTHHME